MEDSSINVAGELSPWPAKNYLARLLRSAGLNIHVGQYAIRVEDCSHFCFQNYGEDICEPALTPMRSPWQGCSTTQNSSLMHYLELRSDIGSSCMPLEMRWSDTFTTTGRPRITDKQAPYLTGAATVHVISKACRRPRPVNVDPFSTEVLRWDSECN
jgi:hypothetical protein